MTTRNPLTHSTVYAMKKKVAPVHAAGVAGVAAEIRAIRQKQILKPNLQTAMIRQKLRNRENRPSPTAEVSKSPLVVTGVVDAAGVVDAVGEPLRMKMRRKIKLP